MYKVYSFILSISTVEGGDYVSQDAKTLIKAVLDGHEFKRASNFSRMLGKEQTIQVDDKEAVKLPAGTEVLVFRKPDSKPHLVLATLTPPGPLSQRKGYWKVFCSGEVKYIAYKSKSSSFSPNRTRRTQDEQFY